MIASADIKAANLQTHMMPFGWGVLAAGTLLIVSVLSSVFFFLWPLLLVGWIATFPIRPILAAFVADVAIEVACFLRIPTRFLVTAFALGFVGLVYFSFKMVFS